MQGLRRRAKTDFGGRSSDQTSLRAPPSEQNLRSTPGGKSKHGAARLVSMRGPSGGAPLPNQRGTMHGRDSAARGVGPAGPGSIPFASLAALQRERVAAGAGRRAQSAASPLWSRWPNGIRAAPHQRRDSARVERAALGRRFVALERCLGFFGDQRSPQTEAGSTVRGSEPQPHPPFHRVAEKNSDAMMALKGARLDRASRDVRNGNAQI